MPKKNLIEEDVQERFFDTLIEQKNGFEKTQIGIYQKLVYMRYEEVIRTSLPLFIKEISQKEFENSIIKFMKDTPNTPFVWQIPKDYMKFVKKEKLFNDRKYLYELIYYDWIEVELYMKEYKFKKQKRFSFDEVYNFSKSARIKKFKYDIIGQKPQEKRDNYLAIYYDFGTNDIIYRQINQLIYELFKRLNKKQTIGEVLKELCIENEIDFKEAKEFLKQALKELHYNKIFV